MKITVVILTNNEGLHIERAISSVKEFADRIVVVDSGSSDNTCKIAHELGALVLKNKWINYASQFNWALDNLPDGTQWVLRLDADEIVNRRLCGEIVKRIGCLDSDIKGVYFERRMCFMEKPIRWGGVFPIRVLRLFRFGEGRCENRWMDEHIIVNGKTVSFNGELIDNNLNSLGWWTDKHNNYASREVIDILNLEYSFMPHESVAALKGGGQAGKKRWIKENIYPYIPIGWRAVIYFFYRYILRFGFLDGREGFAFHVLQGFWYRYLVDMKMYEVKKYLRTQDADVLDAISSVLGITIKEKGASTSDMR